MNDASKSLISPQRISANGTRMNDAEEPLGFEAIGTYGSSGLTGRCECDDSRTRIKTSLSDNEFASSMRILISPKDGVVGTGVRVTGLCEPKGRTRDRYRRK